MTPCILGTSCDKKICYIFFRELKLVLRARFEQEARGPGISLGQRWILELVRQSLYGIWGFYCSYKCPGRHRVYWMHGSEWISQGSGGRVVLEWATVSLAMVARERLRERSLSYEWLFQEISLFSWMFTGNKIWPRILPSKMDLDVSFHTSEYLLTRHKSLQDLAWVYRVSIFTYTVVPFSTFVSSSSGVSKSRTLRWIWRLKNMTHSF